MNVQTDEFVIFCLSVPNCQREIAYMLWNIFKNAHRERSKIYQRMFFALRCAWMEKGREEKIKSRENFDQYLILISKSLILSSVKMDKGIGSFRFLIYFISICFKKAHDLVSKIIVL